MAAVAEAAFGVGVIVFREELEADLNRRAVESWPGSATMQEEEDFARAMGSRLFNANYGRARLKSILSRLKMLYIMT